MSYILDAIKKSEAERGSGSIPSLQTVHSSSLSYKTDNKPIWPIILIALLLLNLIGFIYFVLDKQENTPPTITNTQSNKPIAQDNITKIPYSSSSNPVKNNYPSTPSTIQNNQTTTNQPLQAELSPKSELSPPSAPPKANTTPAVIYNIDELPSYIKQRIPTLDFTGHVYSSSPKFRSIIINGSFLEEGDAINHEFELTEITPNGAIFSYEDILFEISVLTGWSAN